MDFKSYMTAVEKQLHQMTDAQKYDWIYVQARTADEDKREKFLDSLTNRKQKATELSEQEILQWCKGVENGSIHLEVESYEYYEEGAWESDWGTEYHDPFQAMPYLEKAIRSCWQLVMLQEYKVAYPLLHRLCMLKFQVEYVGDDWFGYDDDEDGMEIERLSEEKLISVNLKKLALCLLYSCYQTQTGATRNKKLYEYFMWKMSKELAFTDVLAFGPEELLHTDEFMKEWCQYLIKQDGDRAAELLKDAGLYLGGEEYLLSLAGEQVKKHPSLYLECCKRKYQSGDYASCIDIARVAIERIETDRKIRADISDVAVQACEKADDKTNRKLFCQSAFASEPNGWHLLRLYEFEDTQVIQDALDRLQNVKTGRVLGNSGFEELRETMIADKEQKEIYRFMLGDYGSVVRSCMKDNSSLGWSYSLKGAIVPLLMLAMKEDECVKTHAEQELIRKMEYKIRFEQKDDKTFDDYFSLWRENFRISNPDRDGYMDWLSKEVAERTEGIVGGGHRKSYHKAAELIVMLGTLREECGEVDGMQKLADYYKKLHSRKYAFRNEVDACMRKSNVGIRIC